MTLDTTRADRIGAYGDPRAAATPALDRLAREGAVFEDATSPVPLTLPAHCSLFTGRLPPRHGVHENIGHLDGTTPTIATRLRAKGYRTAALVGSRILERSHGLNRGFEVYDDNIPWRMSGPRPRRSGDAVIDGVLSWIKSIKNGAPFFVWIHFYDAHAPYELKAPFDRIYRDRPYEGAIASVDTQVGRLRRFLDENNLTERTVVVIAGDHGEGLGDHGELTHALFVYQSVLRVPLIIRAPGAALRGRRVKTPVSSVDLMPTVLDLLGTDCQDVDGRSLVPSLLSTTSETAPDVYSENLYIRRHYGWSEMRAIRSGAFKLIDKMNPELYDLVQDPGETHNLAARLPAVTARLALRLKAWHARLATTATGESSTRALDDEVRFRLASLGYVGESLRAKSAAHGELGSDPRDHVALFNCLTRLGVKGTSPTHEMRCWHAAWRDRQ
jgi:arylsulfatase A-like enzyme